MEGGRWNSHTDVIDEAQPRIFYELLPNIVITPKVKNEIPENDDSDHHYHATPVYHTLERGGRENFIMFAKLRSDKPSRHWTNRGLALFCQLND